MRRKYPEAKIYRASDKHALCRNGSIAVVFEPQGKVYSYVAQNYKEVLERLGCIKEVSA